MIYFSRSARETDERCRRKRYLSTEWNGIGLTPEGVAYELELGGILHKGLHSIALDAPIDEVVAVATVNLAPIIARRGQQLDLIALDFAEQSAVVEGILRGHAKCVEPAIREEYTTLFLEEEMFFEQDGVRMAVTPDRILQRRADGLIVYREYKSAKYFSDTWAKQYDRAVQIWAVSLAVEQTKGITINYAQVQGLEKGSPYRGEWSSPWTVGWKKTGYALGNSGIDYSLKRPSTWKGWEKISPSREIEGGLRGWLDTAGLDFSGSFPLTPMVKVDREMVEQWWRQAAAREREIAHANLCITGDAEEAEHYLNTYYPQTFSQCDPGYSTGPCGFLHLCWNKGVEADPLRHGYGLRIPHHASDAAHERRRIYLEHLR